ncbi:MAG: division/cell wall cluster transcriptional repressor MraZ [Candidatus Zixiibacteriota bacterium]|nr:MAG: division/cell wall cluster transcriptional repressor MraZ [candidate division Zixibacteria bacterium]
MVAFKGTYLHSIDHKNRINIPAKFRGNPEFPENEHYVIVRGFEGCLYVYPHNFWLIIEEKLSGLKRLSDPKARYFERLMLSNAADAKIDRQGRIAIPQNLLDLAGISKEVTIRGVFDKIELWDPERLKAYESDQPDSYEDVAGQLLI